jgi:hypothetical protein
MNDGPLPWWLRVSLLVSAVAQIGFGVTLLLNPGAIDSLWPWRLTPLTARLLGASTVVSVPLSVLIVVVNRWSAARIPLVMLWTYRVLQLAAGAIHFDRFDWSRPTTWNYFAGGGFMLVVLGAAVVIAERKRREAGGTIDDQGLLRLSDAGRYALRVVALLYFAIGVAFFVLGSSASPLWFEAPGALTPLTARLFSSPMIGLAGGLLLISFARKWIEVAIPATGMVTFGLAGSLSLLAERSSIAPTSFFGFLMPVTPALLLIIGTYLLVSSAQWAGSWVRSS